MLDDIPEEVIKLYKTIQNAGFEIYFVGGCVRNIILKKPVKDWDLTTNATPEEILKLFPDGFYDNQFGTVGIPVILGKNEETTPESNHGQAMITQKQVTEITTFRREHGYADRRHPKKYPGEKQSKKIFCGATLL